MCTGSFKYKTFDNERVEKAIEHECAGEVSIDCESGPCAEGEHDVHGSRGGPLIAPEPRNRKQLV